MARLLSPRLLVVVTALLGLATTVLAIASELNLALGAAGLALTAMAVLVWSAFSRVQGSLRKSVHSEKALARVATSIDDTDRRLVAAIEALRRDVHNQRQTPAE